MSPVQINQRLWCTHIAKPCVAPLMKPHIWPTCIWSIQMGVTVLTDITRWGLCLTSNSRNWPWHCRYTHGYRLHDLIGESKFNNCSVNENKTPIWIDQTQVGKMCGIIKGATYGFARYMSAQLLVNLDGWYAIRSTETSVKLGSYSFS